MTFKAIGQNAPTQKHERPQEDGPQLGGTTAITPRQGSSEQGKPLAAQIASKASQDPQAAVQWLRSSWQLARHDQDARAKIQAAVEGLTVPCNQQWLLTRIAALLDPYFDKGTPPMVRALEAEDWAEELRQFPKWAVENAARWWKSSENQDRRKRPLEGDIAARCRTEMDAIRAAQVVLSSPVVPLPQHDAETVAPDDADRRRAVADEILKEFSARVKT